MADPVYHCVKCGEGVKVRLDVFMVVPGSQKIDHIDAIFRCEQCGKANFEASSSMHRYLSTILDEERGTHRKIAKRNEKLAAAKTPAESEAIERELRELRLELKGRYENAEANG